VPETGEAGAVWWLQLSLRSASISHRDVVYGSGAGFVSPLMGTLLGAAMLTTPAARIAPRRNTV